MDKEVNEILDNLSDKHSDKVRGYILGLINLSKAHKTRIKQLEQENKELKKHNLKHQ